MGGRPRLLDLFCGAGGAGMGYHRAGFEVIGVDINPQPHYPFEFHQADALKVLDILVSGGTWEGYVLSDFAAIHASPPCHAWSTVSGRGRKIDAARYPKLIAPTRLRLVAAGLPCVIENVTGAPLFNPIRLCGSSFRLNLRRHRLFELGGFYPLFLPPCAHHWQTPRFRSLDGKRKNGYLANVVGVHGHINYAGEAELRNEAMGIDWMSTAELSQAIPPAYTEWIGSRLLEHITAAA